MSKKTLNAIEVLDRLTGDDPEMRDMITEEMIKAQVARRIYEARNRVLSLALKCQALCQCLFGTD